jgi:hypothetical protein
MKRIIQKTREQLPVVGFSCIFLSLFPLLMGNEQIHAMWFLGFTVLGIALVVLSINE